MTTKTKEKVENTPSQPKWEDVKSLVHPDITACLDISYENKESQDQLEERLAETFVWHYKVLLANKIEIDEVVGMIDAEPVYTGGSSVNEKDHRINKLSLKQKLLDKKK